MLGVDSSTHPAYLPPAFATNAINRSFRGGVNSTRPPMRSFSLVFDTKENKEIFERGAIQAFYPYQKMTRATQPHIIVCVNDRILKGRVCANEIYFELLFKGTNPEIMGASLAQATDRLYWQDGVHRPVGWDGQNSSYVIEDKEDSMPVGVITVYINGRMVVITEDNYCIISDYIYSQNVKNSKGVESFVESKLNNDLGAIASPGKFGEVAGAISLPSIPNSNTKPKLLVMQEFGAYTLDLSGARADWINRQIQEPVMDGSGSTAGGSIIKAHSDIFYQSTDGDIQSYKWTTQRWDNQWSETSVSNEVRKYSDLTSPHLRRWTQSMKIKNRLLFSCATITSPCSIGGSHRFGQGIISLDLDKGSTLNESSGFRWDGMWTGPNICGMAELMTDGSRRPMIASHDDDGINRIYELLDRPGDDEIDGVKKKIISFYDTPNLFGQADPAEGLVVNTLNGARAIISEVSGTATVGVSYRPSYSKRWIDMHRSEIGCNEPFPQDTASLDQFSNGYVNFFTKTPSKDDCDPVSGSSSHKANSFQFRISIEGCAEIPYFYASATRDVMVSPPLCQSVIPCKLSPMGDHDPILKYKFKWKSQDQ